MSYLINFIDQKKKAKNDLQSSYYQVRLKEEHIPKTAFNSKFGHYELIVMPFQLTNVLATFNCMMTDIFKKDIDKKICSLFL